MTHVRSTIEREFDCECDVRLMGGGEWGEEGEEERGEILRLSHTGENRILTS